MFAVFALAQGGVVANQSISAIYPAANNPELREIQNDWKNGRMLETIADGLSRKFELKTHLTLIGAECGQANAFYIPTKKAIVLCLELVPNLADALIRENGKRADRAEISNLLGGAIAFVLLHEVGHALIDILGLPVLGREEDAADQISSFIMLNDPELPQAAIAGALWFFRGNQAFFSKRHLSDEHSLNPQRQANLACWAFGRSPEDFSWALKVASVTQQRAARCANEYAQLDRSIRQVLGIGL